jgi:hypothetical protein
MNQEVEDRIIELLREGMSVILIKKSILSSTEIGESAVNLN